MGVLPNTFPYQKNGYVGYFCPKKLYFKQFWEGVIKKLFFCDSDQNYRNCIKMHFQPLHNEVKYVLRSGNHNQWEKVQNFPKKIIARLLIG